MKPRQPTQATGGAPPKADADRAGAATGTTVHSLLDDESLLSPEFNLNLNDRDNPDDSVVVPIVTRMPEGYEVVEHSVGRAVGQWVLQLRCQCGRRWFELEAVDATTCPRCGLLVYVDVRE